MINLFETSENLLTKKAGSILYSKMSSPISIHNLQYFIFNYCGNTIEAPNFIFTTISTMQQLRTLYRGT